MATKGITRNTPKSILAQYITQTRLATERVIMNAQSPEECKDEELTLKVLMWEIDVAHKYKLTPSALAMIKRLMPERSQGIIETLPGTGIWAMLDDSESTVVYFSSIPHAVTSYLECHPGTKITEKLAKLPAISQQWTLDVFRRGDNPRGYVYDASRQQWTLAQAEACVSGACEGIAIDQTDHFPNWYICNECAPVFQYWTSWFPVALMAINGDFAETEEKQEPDVITEQEIRKVRWPGSGRYRDVPVTHAYEIVTFDMSVKTRTHQPHRDHEPSSPTWLEQAIAAETVLYVSKRVGQSQRTFRHERYVNMRGKTIDVRAYDKRIPMSVKRLKQTIHNAIASKQE